MVPQRVAWDARVREASQLGSCPSYAGRHPRTLDSIWNPHGREPAMIWSMASIHIESIEQPFVDDEALAGQALRLVLRAEFLGCLPTDTVRVLGPELVRAVGRCMQQ